jgi:hypothetical protein
MKPTHVVVEGTLQPDGTLVLNQKPDLPPGRVQVMIQIIPDLPKDDPFWQMMHSIWDALKASGHVPRTREQIDADLRELDFDTEVEMREAARLQEQCRLAREQAEKGGRKTP